MLKDKLENLWNDTAKRNRIIVVGLAVAFVLAVAVMTAIFAIGDAKNRADKQSLDEVTSAIKDTVPGRGDLKASVFAQNGDCMAVSGIDGTESAGALQQGEYYIVCKENGKQVVKLGPASSFSVPDMTNAGIPVALQAKLTGLTEQQVKDQQKQLADGIYYATQLNNGVIGSPNFKRLEKLLDVGMDSQDYMDVKAQIAQYYANLNTGYQSETVKIPVTDPAKQFASVSFGTPSQACAAGADGRSDCTTTTRMFTATPTMGDNKTGTPQRITIAASYAGSGAQNITIVLSGTDGSNPVTIYDSARNIFVPQPADGQ
jgi:hypothetical protein